VLAAADMSLANVVRLNVYTTDVGELFRHNAVLTDRFGDSCYATSVVGVAQLPAPQLLVILEATALD
jgi:enamine deaminase RidA (YjgF/YER057c/UK114 family)